MAEESKLESFMAREVEKIGGIFWKFKSTRRGVPDRILVYRGSVFFVELKAPGQKPTAQQLHVHGLLAKAGALVVTLDSEDLVRAFLTRVQAGKVLT